MKSKSINNHPAYWAIIPAAGVGLRMGAAVPKQYLLLGNKTILEHSISALISHPNISKVMVVLHTEDAHWSNLEVPHADKLLATVGGELRAHSVLQGLELLKELAREQDWVLVHDAVRPCLQHRDIDRLMRQLNQHPVGGILGIPVRDTLKRVDDEGRICQTVSREKIWCAQTPQMFRFGILYDAMRKALEEQQLITDESSAVEFSGHTPMMVEGNPQNIKMTYPEDLILAESFMAAEDK